MRYLLTAAVVVLGGAVPPAGESERPVPPPLDQVAAQRFASLLLGSSEYQPRFGSGGGTYPPIMTIADSYVRPVPPTRLAAAALLAMAEASGEPLPAHLRGNLDQVERALSGRDLYQELWQARLALGNGPALKDGRDMKVSVQAMVAVLDPYTVYLGPGASDAVTLLHNDTADVGLVLRKEADGGVLVRMVAPGSPADKEGIRPGDELLEVGGESVRPWGLEEVRQRLRGPQDRPVVVKYRAAGGQVRDVTLRRALADSVRGFARAEGGGWDFVLDPARKIGYVRLGQLITPAIDLGPRTEYDEDGGTSADLRAAIKTLLETGLKGLVLDLRECIGGSLTEAEEVPAEFLPARSIVAVIRERKAADSWRTPERTSRWTDEFTTFPMVVLVGPETSGGGELIAAALQDHGRAKVVGQRTRGKGSVQQVKELCDGQHRIRLTTGHILRPNGKPLDRYTGEPGTDDWGVKPDAGLEIRLTPEFRQQHREWRSWSDARPAGSREVLPLDRLENDPVLHAGLRHLLRQVSDKSGS
jgi:C-terminal processing protease CtpA/Prc